MNGHQKSISDVVMRIFCLSVLWQAVGIISYPVFFPLLAKQFEISGTITGVMLAMTPFVTIISVPFINIYITAVGVEALVFTSGIMFGLSFCCMAFASWTTTFTAFLSISFVSALFVGISVAANIVGEQALLLRYSEKDEREKNLGKFRAASGLGGLICPLLGAAMFAVGEYFAVFLTVGLGYLLISPIIYVRLYKARDQFLAAQVLLR